MRLRGTSEKGHRMTSRRGFRLLRYTLLHLTLSGVFFVAHEWALSGYSLVKVGTLLLLFIVAYVNLQTAMDGSGESIED